MNATEIDMHLASVPAWQQDGNAICRMFRFADHYQTMAFANAVAWISHESDHHPDMLIGYNTCRLAYTTHSEGGLSTKDFACAARVDALCHKML